MKVNLCRQRRTTQFKLCSSLIENKSKPSSVCCKPCIGHGSGGATFMCDCCFCNLYLIILLYLYRYYTEFELALTRQVQKYFFVFVEVLIIAHHKTSDETHQFFFNVLMFLREEFSVFTILH